MKNQDESTPQLHPVKISLTKQCRNLTESWQFVDEAILNEKSDPELPDQISILHVLR